MFDGSLVILHIYIYILSAKTVAKQSFTWLIWQDQKDKRRPVLKEIDSKKVLSVVIYYKDQKQNSSFHQYVSLREL